MQSFNYPAMPMYTQQQEAYYPQMYDWHMQMVKYPEEKRNFHMERARHFKHLMGGNVVQMERLKDVVV